MAVYLRNGVLSGICAAASIEIVDIADSYLQSLSKDDTMLDASMKGVAALTAITIWGLYAYKTKIYVERTIPEDGNRFFKTVTVCTVGYCTLMQKYFSTSLPEPILTYTNVGSSGLLGGFLGLTHQIINGFIRSNGQATHNALLV